MPDGGTPSFEQAPKTPESAIENPSSGPSFESPKPASEQAPAPAPAPIRAPAPAPAPAVRKDPTTIGVESILEEGLAETYAKMDAAHKEKFRKEGERVTGKIAAMVRAAKVKAREVLSLITGWLKIIPGANRFFLIQEAKIKTDKIVALGEQEKSKRGVL